MWRHCNPLVRHEQGHVECKVAGLDQRGEEEHTIFGTANWRVGRDWRFLHDTQTSRATLVAIGWAEGRGGEGRRCLLPQSEVAYGIARTAMRTASLLVLPFL